MTGTEGLTAELKPCPFCGNAEEVRLVTSPLDDMSWVACPHCGLEAPSETGVTEADAIAYWNRRAALSQPPSAQEAKPVAWRWRFVDARGWHYAESDPAEPLRDDAAVIEPLFASPAPALPETGVTRFSFEKLVGGTTMLPVVREDGEWIKYVDYEARIKSALSQDESGWQFVPVEPLATDAEIEMVRTADYRSIYGVEPMGRIAAELAAYRSACPASPLAKRGG